MAFYQAYGKHDDSGPAPTVVAWGVALLLNAAFYMFAFGLTLRSDQTHLMEVVPPSFNIDRVEIDAGLLEDMADAERPPARPLDDLADFELPDTQVGMDSFSGEVRIAPAPMPIENPLLQEAPQIDTSTLSRLAEQQESGQTAKMEANLDQLTRQMLESETVDPSPARPMLDPSTLQSMEAQTGAAMAQSLQGLSQGAAGQFSDLDTLLNQVGPLREGTAPILMPGDLLFDYDSFSLRSDALESLQKLGSLIQRNPQANFLIEGHSDAFGPDQYNMWLSTQRAQAVKSWLVGQMNVDPTRVQTQGMGKTRLIVPADRTVEEQQLNRRVEIIIRTP
ncbi:MAG: OmpA family protein [Verrucomicrobiales bacterium]